MQEQEILQENHFEAAVYFADTPRNIYQLRQWYQPFEQLAEKHPVVLVLRSKSTVLRAIEETHLPVAYCPAVSDLEELVLTQRFGAVFYPNQNAKNFQMLRNHGPAHIWINHGESDKASMTTNQVKAYDQVFVAGQAAVDRLERNVLGFDVANHALAIGRPQIDCVYEPEPLPEDGRTTLFYSPTWEGDRPSMSYSSITSHAQTIIDAIISNPEYRLIFRPHPSTGNICPEHKQALDELIRRIDSANHADPQAHHLVDQSRDFGWQLSVADYCIADVSAVAFDWLATGKPIFITEPVGEEVFLEDEGLIARLPKLDVSEAHNVLALFEQYGEQGLESKLQSLTEYYFGDVQPGKSMERWIAAASQTIVERQQLIEQSKSRSQHVEDV